MEKVCKHEVDVRFETTDRDYISRQGVVVILLIILLIVIVTLCCLRKMLKNNMIINKLLEALDNKKNDANPIGSNENSEHFESEGPHPELHEEKVE